MSRRNYNANMKFQPGGAAVPTNNVEGGHWQANSPAKQNQQQLRYTSTTARRQAGGGRQGGGSNMSRNSSYTKQSNMNTPPPPPSAHGGTAQNNAQNTSDGQRLQTENQIPNTDQQPPQQLPPQQLQQEPVPNPDYTRSPVRNTNYTAASGEQLEKLQEYQYPPSPEQSPHKPRSEAAHSPNKHPYPPSPAKQQQEQQGHHDPEQRSRPSRFEQQPERLAEDEMEYNRAIQGVLARTSETPKQNGEVEYLFKYIIVGDCDVGKTSLMLQFTDKK